MVATQPPPSEARQQPGRPSILIDGREQPGLAASLVAMTATDAIGGMARCELTLSNWGAVPGGVGYPYFDRAVVDFGKRLQMRAGDGDAAVPLFDGRITGVEARFPSDGAPALTLLAEDRLQDLRMTRRTRGFDDVADADVVRQVAADHGLTASVDLPGPTHRHLAQLNQSDLAFLLDRCRLLDADLWIENRTLHAAARSRRGGRPIAMTQGRHLHEFPVIADLAHQFTALRLSGWDVQGKEAVLHEATDSALGSELGGDRSGASVLRGAFGERAQAIVHAGPTTADEARVAGDAIFREGARRFVHGHGFADTRLGLAVGRSTAIDGVGPLFDGTYTVIEVTHTFDATRGLRTAFGVERPGVGTP
jgi:phage protein D